jgi:hypothetical protein
MHQPPIGPEPMIAFGASLGLASGTDPKHVADLWLPEAGQVHIPEFRIERPDPMARAVSQTWHAFAEPGENRRTPWS